MEVREVFKLQDPVNGRNVAVHLTESEVLDVMQAGLFFLMQQGYINFKAFETAANDIEVPEGATPQ